MLILAVRLLRLLPLRFRRFPHGFGLFLIRLVQHLLVLLDVLL